MSKKQSIATDKPDLPDGLFKYYDYEDHDKEWHLHCKACGKGWAVSKGIMLGNSQLHLLNHAYSHKPGGSDVRP